MVLSSRTQSSLQGLVLFLQGGGREHTRFLGFALSGGLVLLFALFHAAVYFHGWTDENIHSAVAADVLAGRQLYAEVSSARPPLAIWPLVWLQALGLSPLLSARLLTFFTTVLTGALLALTARKLWGDRTGYAALVSWFLAPVVWGYFAYTGIGLTALWASGALFGALVGLPIGAVALLAGVAILTGQHAIPVLAVSGVLVLARRGWGSATLYALGTFAVVGVGLAFVGDALPAMWASVVERHAYHLGGRDLADSGALEFGTWALDQAPLVVLASFAFPGGSAERWVGGAVLLHLAAVVGMGSAQELYLFPIVPLLALLAGRGLLRAVDRLGPWGLVAPSLMAGIGWSTAAAILSERDHEDYSSLPPMRSVQMARVIQPVVATKIAHALRMQGATQGTVFGHPTISNLVAMELGLPIAGGYADLDARWFESGALQATDVISSLDADGLTIAVLPNWYFNKDPLFRSYWQHCFDVTVFEREPGSGVPRMFVYVRKGDAPVPCLPAAGAVADAG